MAHMNRFETLRSLSRGCVVLSLLVASACSPSKPTAESPSGSEERSPGQKCLMDAAAPRTPPPDAPSKIDVSHILVRHAELDRPEGATRTREEACLRALEALGAIEKSGDWNQAVTDYSDSGQESGGALGRVGRDEVTKPFGDAAFSLDVNELSYVVESDRGFHVILRTN